MRARTPASAIAVALAGAALCACQADTAELTPIPWQKVAGPVGGAVLGLGPAGSFDELGSFTVRAFQDGGVVWMYYGGAAVDPGADPACPGIADVPWRIGLARSTDGVNFTREPGTVTGTGVPGGTILDHGAAGQFDSFLTYRPYVLKDGTTWRMWYNGSTLPFNCPTGTLALDRRIGYADSGDGLAWTRHYDGAGPGGSVLPLGGAGEFDAQQVGYVWVIKDGAEYKMYYSANDALNFWRVGLAVSSDARTWTKVRGKGATGAVLDLGSAGSLDAACAYQPSVVKERDQLYRMWYRACDRAGSPNGPSRGTIGYAESNDGITWVKIPQPGPDGSAIGLGDPGSFDAGGLTTPSVFLDTASWQMYYAGVNAGVYNIGLARAPR